MSGPLLQLKGVSVRYGARQALQSVSCEFRAGELVALAGPNGSGKSTLFRAAVGLVPLAEGSLAFEGRDAAALSILGRARTAAWMPQEELEGDDITVEEYVRYGRNPYLGGVLPHPDPDPGTVSRALEDTGAREFRWRAVRTLSGGERQKVRLARVLAQETPLLLLDEPTSHLDIGHQLEVLQRVREIARRSGRCVVVALHDLNLAARFSDRIVVLSRGHLVSDGSPQQVLSPTLLQQVWGIDAELRRDARSRIPYLLPRLPTDLASGRPAQALRIHVVAGGGSGLELLGRLIDRGYDLTVGALPLFDSDSELAGELHIPCLEEVPFAPLSQGTLQELRKMLGACEVVIVAAFPVGPTNLANLQEVSDLGDRKRVLLLRQPAGRAWDFTGGTATALRERILAQGGREVADPAELLVALRDLGSATRGDRGPEGPA